MLWWRMPELLMLLRKRRLLLQKRQLLLQKLWLLQIVLRQKLGLLHCWNGRWLKLWIGGMLQL